MKQKENVKEEVKEDMTVTVDRVEYRDVTITEEILRPGKHCCKHIKTGSAYDIGTADQCALQHCRPALYRPVKR